MNVRWRYSRRGNSASTPEVLAPFRVCNPASEHNLALRRLLILSSEPELDSKYHVSSPNIEPHLPHGKLESARGCSKGKVPKERRLC